jgi:hypothetical protein
VIAGLLPLREHDGDFLARFVRPQLRNWNGTVVGGLRPTEMLGGP